MALKKKKRKIWPVYSWSHHPHIVGNAHIGVTWPVSVPTQHPVFFLCCADQILSVSPCCSQMPLLPAPVSRISSHRCLLPALQFPHSRTCFFSLFIFNIFLDNLWLSFLMIFFSFLSWFCVSCGCIYHCCFDVSLVICSIWRHTEGLFWLVCFFRRLTLCCCFFF